MKRSILLYCILLSVPAFSQSDNTSLTTPDQISFKTHGYVEGTRLDSIDALFAEFTWRIMGEVDFDYGQGHKKRKERAITDSNGIPLKFPAHKIPFLLNFFYFNGWQPVQVSIDAVQSQNILRKN